MPTPEQIKRLQLTAEKVGRYTTAVDVWAVGILCYECLTGGPTATNVPFVMHDVHRE